MVSLPNFTYHSINPIFLFKYVIKRIKHNTKNRDLNSEGLLDNHFKPTCYRNGGL